jgi:hypothetical protein
MRLYGEGGLGSGKDVHAYGPHKDVLDGWSLILALVVRVGSENWAEGGAWGCLYIWAWNGLDVVLIE